MLFNSSQLEQETADNRMQSPFFRGTDFCGFVGQSPCMQNVYDIISKAAPSLASVLITGETGTGKELAAEALHKLGPRKHENLIAINCAAIPKDLLESAIFGHVKGAFTGASSDHDGAAAQAHKGTLFLDELTEMPYEMQAKLLRFVQTGTYTPVGSTRSLQADIRFIAATNRDPVQAISAGTLREDLYYRLCTVTVALPPLHTRGDDVALISRYLLTKFNALEKKNFHDFTPAALHLLTRTVWNGNVRALENTIRRAIVLYNDQAVDAHMLTLPAPRTEMPQASAPVVMPLAEVERAAIENAIKICDGNITQAAMRLQINPSTIHRKQKEWQRQGD